MSIRKPSIIQSTLDISNCQGANKFVRDIESLTNRVVILCKLIRMGTIVLFETSGVPLIRVNRNKTDSALIKYSRYRDSTVYDKIFSTSFPGSFCACNIFLLSDNTFLFINICNQPILATNASFLHS